jgi:hypothetical protein
MPSSDRCRTLAFAVVIVLANAEPRWALAQQQARGFAVDRFYPSAPGAGWFVMDELDLHEDTLGGAMALTTGYALRPLRVTDGHQHRAVVSDQASADFGFAATYDRWRLYLDLNAPLVAQGQGGTVAGYSFVAPAIDPGVTPDLFSDIRVGVDGRLFGGPQSPFRLGVGAQLIVPNGNRADYDTDGTFRGMVRALFAGDRGLLTYAGQLGVHIRPLSESTIPGSPRGSELLFGLAAGARVPVGSRREGVVVVGPEIYGETALGSFLGADTTGLEGLLTARLEGTSGGGPQVRVKLGTGGAIHPHFGAPEWRAVFGIELFDRGAHRAGQGITNTR